MSWTYRRMAPEARVYVAGHLGLVGSAIVRGLQARGYADLVLRSRAEVDLTRQAAVEALFAQERPEFVVVAAAKVGGILANNTQRADFIRDNLLIATNLIDAAHRSGVQRLLFLGSSCVYPREPPIPIPEEALLTGPFEPTNEPYAVAKVAALKLCEALNAQHGTRYVTVMPTNVYGPNDNFDLATSHVLPALLRKAHDAKARGDAQLAVWGSGRPRREFIHADDLASACLHVLESTDETRLLNVGVGEDVSIGELAELISEIVGYEGTLEFDVSKPDGMLRKLLDVSKLRSTGWAPRIALRDGIAQTYAWYARQHA